jgi:hypothetical protein
MKPPASMRQPAAGLGKAAFTSIGALLLVALSTSLSGCVDMLASNPPEPNPHVSSLVRREGVSPRGASLAVASLSGVPQLVSGRFETALDAAAKRQDITVADGRNANYLVRGYLNAYATENGTAVAIVWDIFDAKKHRAQRIDDSIVVKGRAGDRPATDPWALVDDTVLTMVAARSADDLAAFLTNTPEALAADVKSGSASTVADAAVEKEGQTIIAETPPPARPAAPGLGVAALH